MIIHKSSTVNNNKTVILTFTFKKNFDHLTQPDKVYLKIKI